MHGRKRAEYKHRFQDPQVAQALAQKAQQWHALNQKALQECRDEDGGNDQGGKTLSLLDKMLRVNPDPLHLWNHRRELLLKNNNETSSSWNLPTELALTAAALEKNPKAYGAWFHRKWSLQQQEQNTAGDLSQVLPNELNLTEQFLDRDERNFHCWNYRRFLVGLELGQEASGSWSSGGGSEENGALVVIGPQMTAATSTTTSDNYSNKQKTQHVDRRAILQREWNFTQTKIVQNFSNFSAFHYRSKLLLLADNITTATSGSGGWNPAENKDQPMVQTIGEQEWSLMENIMFTEPDDQTIWWYHRFVVDWVSQQTIIVGKEQQGSKEWYCSWLEKQAETLQVLVEEDDSESGCKWGLLGWHLVLSRLVSSVVATEMGDNVKEWREKAESILDQLVELDPDRKQRYIMMKQ